MIYFLEEITKEDETLLTRKKKFGDLGISLILFIVEGDEGYKNRGYLPYPQFLDFLSLTRVILEIVQKEQYGLTLRTMEALFFQKKLVTTNYEIKRYYFYHPDNIFILGYDSLENLSAFMNKLYKKTQFRYDSIFQTQIMDSTFFLSRET